MKMQKLGGYSSIAIVCIILVMGGILVVILGDFTGLDIYDSSKMIAAYQASPIAFLVYYSLGMILSILGLIVFLSLEERMRANAPNLMRIAVIAGAASTALTLTAMIGGFFRNILMAATNDMSAFRAFLVLHELLRTAATSILGWGFLLIGCAAIKTRELPRILSFIIILLGIESIIGFVFTVAQFDLGSFIYALLALIVYVWIGVVLLRENAAKLA